MQTLRRTLTRAKRASRAAATHRDHALESLEQRQLMTVTMSADGWTDITPSADSRQIYVSSSTGNDANTGLTSASPLRTIAAALSKTRTGFPDWVLLKKGDVFNETINWNNSGRNAQEPMVLAAYGTGARPSVQPLSGQDGFSLAAGTSRHDIAIIGLDFYAKTRDPAFAGYDAANSPTGIRWISPGSNLLVEDCSIRFFNNDLVIQGPDPVASVLTNFTLRRSVVTDAYSTTAHGQGIYLSGVQGITIQENLFDHNGWYEGIAGAEKTVFNHNIYLDNENYSDNNLITGNILARASSHGLQLRAGGTVTDNFIFDNPLGMLIGGGQDYTISSPNGVLAYASNNVILESGDIGTGDLARGFAFDLVNIRQGLLSGNIMAHDRSASTGGHGLSVDAPTSNLAANNNIVYDWHSPSLIAAGTGVTQSGNYYGNYGAANTPGYIDPNRSAATYNATLGGAATEAAFLAAVRGQSRSNWNTALTAVAANAYIRAGFATSAGADTTAPTAAASLTNVSTAGATSYSFTVTYSDNVAVNVSTLDGSDVRVTGPNGFSQLAALVSVNVNSNGTPRTATYSITPPAGAWSSGANGTYTVSLVAGQVADTSANTASAATLGTFTVAAPAADTAAPTAVASLSNVSAAGGSSYTFTVAYSDNVAVNVSTLDGSDIRVTGPNGYSVLASLVSIDVNSNGTPRTATYSITPPAGAWSSGANGTYTVSLVAGQVADTSANTAAAATLGTFTVAVPSPVFSSVATFGNLTNYTTTITPSNWSVVTDGSGPVLSLNSTSYSNLSGNRLGELAVVAGQTYTDLDMTLSARSTETLASNAFADFAVVFSYVDANNYDYAWFNASAGSTIIASVDAGVRTTLATAATAGLTDSNWHSLRVLRVGQTVTVSRDGATLMSATSASLAAAGAVGVGSYNDAANFDDIAVTVPVTAPPPDTTAPSAVATLANVAAAGATSYSFTVTFTDDTAINASTLDGSDVRITGPNGFSQLASLVSVNVAGNGASRTATYSINPPGGAWSFAANGTYTASLVAGQVADTSGNTAAAATLGTFTVAAPDTAAPTAGATLANVSTAGGTSYTFTVTFTDNAAVDVATLDGSDVRITGPNGFSQLASLVSVNVAGNGASRTATYSINPPGGAWSFAANGTYTASLVAGQVADTSGNTAAAGTLGTFTVAAPDTAAPTAGATLANVSTAGATSYSFTVTYTDNAAVDVATLDGSDVRVTGPNGFSQLASLVGVNLNSNGTVRTATYSITPPGGAWSYAANGTYTASLVAGQVADTSGNTAAAGTLGTFTVAAPDTAAPSAAATLSDVTTAGGTSYSFTVTYTDNAAINASTLDGLDISITGPNSFSTLASLVSVNVAGNGAVRTATYSFTVPGGAWDYTANGDYTVALVAAQVADTSGNAAPAGTLGVFNVNVPMVVFSSITNYGKITDYSALNSSRWAVQNDANGPALTLTATNYSPLSGGRLGELAIAGSSQADFDLSLTARSTEDLTTNPSANYSVVFAYVDANNYSFVTFSASAANTELASVVNGQKQTLATGTLPGVTDNAWHSLRLVRSGTTVTAMVDGNRVVGTTDARLGLAGKVGVGAVNDGAAFDDVNPVAISAAKLRVTRSTTKKGSTSTSAAALPSNTPVDLGSAAATTAAPTQTYVITNDGGKNLVVGNITLPTGYTYVKQPKLVLAAGESDTLVIALDTMRLGIAAGSVAFTTNDPSQPVYSTDIKGTVSTPLFNEAFYLQRNPDVAADVARGVWGSGYAHFVAFGQREGRSATPIFNEAFYLSKNPGVAAAVAAGSFRSGFEHFVLYGQRENRSFSPYFDERTYLSLNPDVATAVANGGWRSGAEHFAAFGLNEGRRFTALYNETTYLALNPDVAADVARGVWSSGYAHFMAFGRAEGREYSATYSEATYLRLNPDVAADVARGVWASGLIHFLRFGQYEGRIAI